MRLLRSLPPFHPLRSILLATSGSLCLLFFCSCDKLLDSNYPIVANDYVVLSTSNHQYHNLTIEISDYYQAPILHIDKNSQSELLKKLRIVDPIYALVVLPPQRITENTVGPLFEAFCAIHEEPDDPFIDVAYGYISGLNIDAARDLFYRTKSELDTIRSYLGLSHVYELDVYCHLRVNEYAGYYAHGGWDTTTVIYGDARWESDQTVELTKFTGNQLIFCCGHGSYTSICGIRREHFEHMSLSNSIILSGACHTGGIYLGNQSACIAMQMISHGAKIHIANVSLNGWAYMEHIAEGIFYYDQTIGESFRNGLNIVNEYRDLDTIQYVIMYGDPSYRPVVARWR